jgi:hypothetical protein
MGVRPLATSHLAPEALVVPGDLVTLKEARDFIAESGHPSSMTTMKRWIVRDEIRMVRLDRTDYVSMTDILIAHRNAFTADR